MIKEKKARQLMKYFFNIRYMCNDLSLVFNTESEAKRYIKNFSDKRDRIFQELNATLWIILISFGLFFEVPFFAYGALFLLFYTINNRIIKKDTIFVNSGSFIKSLTVEYKKNEK